MDAFKEFCILPESTFPVDAFIIDNRKAPINYSSHWHDYVELVYVLDGSVTLQHNDKTFKSTKNDLAIFNSGVIHSTVCEPEEKGKLLIIQFLPSILNTSYTSTFESKYIFSFLGSDFENTYHIADTFRNSRGIYDLAIGLYKEFTKKEQGYELFVKSCIYQLIVYLLRNNILNVSKPTVSDEDIKKLDPLLKFIENNFTSDINLSKASKMLNFSYTYLSKYFKKVTGKNFKEYIDFIRVHEAEKLILSQKMSISEIAYEVGFSNVSCFNRTFKRTRNYSPSSLRKTKTAKR